MSVINTNYLALVSQNNLSRSQGALGTAIERLSSGLRINSAKDDAAGQAIANRFTANIKGLSQASRNANDGISIAQTTEGALNEINNNLQRIRELAVQAANGTNSSSDLQSIQDEIGERLQEINRVSTQTQFNGVKVLASDSTLKIQVGAHDSETISINLNQVDATTLGLDSLTVKKTALNVGEAIDLDSQLAGSSADEGIDISGALSQLQAAGISVDVSSVSLHQVMEEDGTTAVAGGYALKVGDEYYAVTTADTSATTTGEADIITLAKATGTITDNSGSTNVDAFIKVSYDVDGNVATYATINGTNYGVGTAADGDTGYGDDATVALDISDTGTDSAFTGVATASPLSKIDAAISDVDQLRSALGAVQNRFESTIANLSNTVNNLSAARSRIEDADYAVEVSNMTRAQILQQAGTSVLAQANQVPQTVLSLLR